MSTVSEFPQKPPLLQDSTKVTVMGERAAEGPAGGPGLTEAPPRTKEARSRQRRDPETGDPGRTCTHSQPSRKQLALESNVKWLSVLSSGAQVRKPKRRQTCCPRSTLVKLKVLRWVCAPRTAGSMVSRNNFSINWQIKGHMCFTVWKREGVQVQHGSAGKEPTCNAGDLGSIPGLGRSPAEGKGYPLQYSGLENSMDCIVCGVSLSQTNSTVSKSS